MIKVETRAKKGFEDIYELISKKLDALEEAVRAEFEARKAELVAVLETVSETVAVEVEDICCVTAPTESLETIAVAEVNATETVV